LLTASQRSSWLRKGLSAETLQTLYLLQCRRIMGSILGTLNLLYRSTTYISTSAQGCPNFTVYMDSWTVVEAKEKIELEVP